MEYNTCEIVPKEITVAEVDIKIRETGEDIDDVLLKAGKRVIGAGSMISGAGLIYHATKQEDQTTAIVEGIFGVALEVIGACLFFSNTHRM